MFLYSNGRVSPYKMPENKHYTYEPKPIFASVLPVPPEEELSYQRDSSQPPSDDPFGRPSAAVIQYRILAFRRLSHHTVRDGLMTELLQSCREYEIPLSMHIRYFLPEELECEQREFNGVIAKTVERVCVFLGINDQLLDIRAAIRREGTDLLLEDQAFISIELFEAVIPF
ncbi:MAG TPA: hypothetical protein VKR06_03270 [Ktedonosporobacter sp.]|nr:hypothetical protein [Ktedonosporobacter sp.]